MRVCNWKQIVLVVFLVGVVASAAVAQQARSTAKPLATPPRVSSDAEIISRSDDYSTAIVAPADKTGNPDADTGSKNYDERLKRLESNQKSTYDDKQKRLLLNLDILTRAEQRTESLRKQLFEMIEKENTVKSRLAQIEFDMRPEMIERALQLNGSMYPEEVRESKRKSLDAERTNLQALLAEIQTTRASLDLNLGKAQIMVDKLRDRLEKDIDDSFLKDNPEN